MLVKNVLAWLRILFKIELQFASEKGLRWACYKTKGFWKYEFVLDFENMTPFHLAAEIGHFLFCNSLILKWLISTAKWSGVKIW